MRIGKKLLAVLLTLLLVLALAPSMTVSAATEPTGRLMDFPLLGKLTTWETFCGLYNSNGNDVEAALNAFANLPNVDAATVDQLRTWLNEFGAIFDNEYIAVLPDHDHVNAVISGDTATVTVDDCEFYDLKVDNVLVEAQGDLTLSADDIGLVLKDNTVQLSLTGQDILDILDGVVIEVSANVCFKGALGFLSRLDINPSNNVSVNARSPFEILTTVHFSFDVSSGEIDIIMDTPDIDMDFSADDIEVTSEGTLGGFAANIIQAGLGAITPQINNLISTLKADVLDTLDISALLDQIPTDSISDAYLGFFNDINLSYELSDLISALNNRLSRSFSETIGVPYSFGYSYDNLVNGTKATINLDDVVKNSWLHDLNAGPVDTAIYFRDGFALAGMLPSDIIANIANINLTDLLNQNLVDFVMSVFADRIAGSQIFAAADDALQNICDNLTSVMISNLNLSTNLGSITIGSYTLPLTPFFELSNESYIALDKPVENTVNKFLKNNFLDVAKRAEGKIAQWAGIVADNIGICATLSATFNPGVITALRLTGVSQTLTQVVKPDERPVTGDSNTLMVWMLTSGLAMATAITTLTLGARRKRKEDC